MKRILFLCTVLLLTACGEDPYRNLYDGIKDSNDAKRSPNERAIAPAPSYDNYKKERGTPQEK